MLTLTIVENRQFPLSDSVQSQDENTRKVRWLAIALVVFAEQNTDTRKHIFYLCLGN